MPGNRSTIVRISGRVQGVGFRDWTRREAHALGLSGWVRNLASGEVEALFTGPSEAVQTMLAACRRGPSLARVQGLTVVESDEIAVGQFRIAHGR